MRKFVGVRCRKSINYVEKTLDYAEISTANKTDNKLARLLNVPNNRETKKHFKISPTILVL